jgi:hypothetical protein
MFVHLWWSLELNYCQKLTYIFLKISSSNDRCSISLASSQRERGKICISHVPASDYSWQKTLLAWQGLSVHPEMIAATSGEHWPQKQGKK